MEKFTSNLNSLQNTYKYFGLTIKDLENDIALSKPTIQKLLNGEEATERTINKMISKSPAQRIEKSYYEKFGKKVNSKTREKLKTNEILLCAYLKGEILSPDVMQMLQLNMSKELYNNTFKNKFIVTNRAICGLLDFYLIMNGQPALIILQKHHVVHKHKRRGYSLGKMVYTNEEFVALLNDLEKLPHVLDMENDEMMFLTQDRYMYLNQDIYYKIAHEAKDINQRSTMLQAQAYLFETGTSYASIHGTADLLTLRAHHTITRKYENHEEFRQKGSEYYCNHVKYALKGMLGYDKREELNVVHDKKDCVLHNPKIKTCKFKVFGKGNMSLKIINNLTEDDRAKTGKWFDELIAREKLRDASGVLTLSSIGKL